MSPSIIALCLSLVFGAVSVSLGLYVSRRQFYRRNAHGVELFPNFRAAVTTSIWEKCLIVVSQLAAAFFVGLLLMFAIMHFSGADEPIEYKSPRALRHTARAPVDHH